MLADIVKLDKDWIYLYFLIIILNGFFQNLYPIAMAIDGNFLLDIKYMGYRYLFLFVEVGCLREFMYYISQW